MKKTILKTLPVAIFLIAYTLVVFLIVKNYTAAFILSYVFVLISLGMGLVAFLLIGRSINSKFLTYHIFYIAASYTILSLIMNTIFIMFSKNMSYKVPLILNIIALAGYSIYFIIHFGAAKQIASNEIETKKQLAFVRTSSEIVNNILREIIDIPLQKKVESLYDAIRNSQAIGTSATTTLEHQIIDDITQLERFFLNGNIDEVDKLIADIKHKLVQRNAIIRMGQNEV